MNRSQGGPMPEDLADEELWLALRELMSRADPLPAAVRDAARASLSWRDPDAALARLVADSAAALAPVAVRGGGEPRLLTFETDASLVGPLTIEVEASRADRLVRLVGQLVPPMPAQIRIDHRDGHMDVNADQLGRFAADGIAPGPVRLECTPSTGSPPVRTAWVLL